MNKILQFVFSIILTVFILTVGAKAALSFRSIYYQDIKSLKISEEVNMDKEKIKKNYDHLIDYLEGKESQLKFPDFKMSDQGKIHFEEVKEIFNFVNIIFYISLFVSIFGIVLCILKKKYQFTLYTGIMIISVPIILGIFSLIDFNALFTVFHKIAFSNDYWLFDPAEDPIITILPEAFFMHEMFFILGIMLIAATILILLYKKVKNKNN